MSESNQLQPARGAGAEILRRIEAAARPVLEAHGLELFDLSLRAERGGWVLRVVVDAPASRDATGGVKLDECAEVSRDLSTALDVEDPVAHAYVLEVSSPGIDRPLRGPTDYARFAGKQAKVTLTEAIEGVGTVVRGLIAVSSNGDLAIVREGGETIVIAAQRIRSARLVYELPAQAKKNPSKKKRRSSTGRRD